MYLSLQQLQQQYSNNNYPNTFTMSTGHNKRTRTEEEHASLYLTQQEDLLEDDESQDELIQELEPTLYNKSTINLQDPPSMSASASAKQYLILKTESLPTKLKSFLLLRYARFQKLRMHGRTLEQRISKFTEDYIPRSAQFSHDLIASPKVKETDSFRAIDARIKEAALAYQKCFAEGVKEMIKLELLQVEKDMNHFFFLFLTELASILFRFHSTTDDIPANEIANTVLFNLPTTFFVHLPLTKSSAKIGFKEFAKLNSNFVNNQPNKFGTIATDMAEFARWIFQETWTIQCAEYDNRSHYLAMNKTTDDITYNRSTVTTNDLILNEAPQDQETINSLVHQAVAESTKDLNKKIEKLQQQLKRQPKNNRRGTQPGASPKTNAGAQPSNPSSKPASKPAPKPILKKKIRFAAAKDNDSNDDNSVGSTSKSKKKKKNSRKPRPKSSSKPKKS